jgi:hypothetical protein
MVVINNLNTIIELLSFTSSFLLWGSTGGAGTVYTPGASEFIPGL